MGGELRYKCNLKKDGGYSQPFGMALKIGGDGVFQVGRAWGNQPLLSIKRCGPTLEYSRTYGQLARGLAVGILEGQAPGGQG